MIHIQLMFQRIKHIKQIIISNASQSADFEIELILSISSIG